MMHEPMFKVYRCKRNERAITLDVVYRLETWDAGAWTGNKEVTKPGLIYNYYLVWKRGPVVR